MTEPFIETFGDAPRIRVLNFLLCEGKYFDYSLTDIMKNSNISWHTLKELFPQLIKLEIVKKTRKVGRATMYQLNTENERVQELLDLRFKMCKYAAEKEAETLHRGNVSLKV